MLVQKVKTWIMKPPFKHKWKQTIEFGDRSHAQITSLIHTDRNPFYCIRSIRVVNRFNQSVHMDGPFIPIAKPDSVSGSVTDPQGFELFVKTNAGDKFITVEYEDTSWVPASWSMTPPFYFEVATKKMRDVKNDVFFRTIESIACDGDTSSAYPRHIVDFAQNAPSLNDSSNMSLYENNLCLEHPLSDRHHQREYLFTPISQEEEEEEETLRDPVQMGTLRDPFGDVIYGND